MKKVFASFIVFVLFLSIPLLFFNRHTGDKMTIKTAKLTEEQQSIFQLLKNNSDNTAIFDVNVDGNDNIKYAYIKLYTLNKNGEWIKANATGGLLQQYFGQKNKTNYLLALVDINSESGRVSTEGFSAEFQFPKIDNTQPSDNIISKSFVSLSDSKIVSNKEIPLLIYGESITTLSKSLSTDSFFNTNDLVDFNSVNAVTITFTEKPMNW